MKNKNVQKKFLKCHKEIEEKCITTSLYKEGKKVVVYRGDIENVDILFIGEAPGKMENEKGFPFVGPSGRILDLWISSMTGRNRVGITNTCMLIPTHGNSVRKPSIKEMIEYRPMLNMVVNEVKPRMIVLIGSTASEGYIGMGIKDARKKIWVMNNPNDGKEMKIGAIYHPAYFLRQGSYGMHDFKKLMEMFQEKGD